MSSEAFIFYVFSLLALLASAGVVLNVRNTIYAALCLVVAMLALAVLFIALEAQFLGVLQVMVYAGAIVVLFLFVIMLLHLKSGEMGAETQLLMKTVGAAVVLGASAKLVGVLRASAQPWGEAEPGYGTVRAFGLALYRDYILVVEVAGILLLAGIVAAVLLGRQRSEP